MLQITVHEDSDVPPYEQVRLGIAEQVNNRTLPVGTKLPTVRGLAAELGLAANTVAKAYRELEQAQLIETRGRAGTFVSHGGHRSGQLAAEYAAEYARKVLALGIDRDEAMDIVRAALKA